MPECIKITCVCVCVLVNVCVYMRGGGIGVQNSLKLPPSKSSLSAYPLS